MSEILKYNGDIAIVSRWTKALLGYHFSVIYCLAQMIVDVDPLI